MASKADRLLERLAGYVPPLTAKGDVATILEARFQGCYRETTGSSHTWVVEHESLAHAQELGFSVNYLGGNLSIPVTGGRHVKAVYVKRLLLAIEVRAEYDRRQAEQNEAGAEE